MDTLKRTNSSDPDFISLVMLLDAELAALDGDEHAFYAKLNKTDNVPHCVVAWRDGKAVGTGAIREFEKDTTEIKRMYVSEQHRKSGVATMVLLELERWAKELGYKYCILETGHRQPEAIALYEKMGFTKIPNYGKYAGVSNSVCFKKEIQ